MWELVLSYELFARKDGSSQITLNLASGAEALQPDSPQAFMSLVTILQKENPVYFDSANGVLGTGPERPGEFLDRGV